MDDGDIRSLLLADPGVAGLVEFGSSARQSMRRDSDLDVLAVIRDSSVRGAVRARIDHLASDFERLSATALTCNELQRTVTRSPSFGAHLRDEGRVFGAALDRRSIRGVLTSIRVDADAVREEVLDLGRHVDRLSNERMLAGRYDTAVGRLFSIARAAAILHGMTHGRPAYDWRTVFSSLADRDPSLEEPTQTVLSLRPYYEALDGRRTPPPTASQTVYRAGIDATRSIVDSVPKRAARA